MTRGSTYAFAARVFTRWLDAIHHPDDEERLRAAVSDRIRIDRYEPAPRGQHAAVVSTLVGLPTVGAWLRLAPTGSVFAIAGTPVADGDVVRAEYSYRFEAFTNGGLWIARMFDGRIDALAHRPFALSVM